MGAGASAGREPGDADTESVMMTTVGSGTRPGGDQSYYIEPSKCINMALHVEVSKVDAAVVALPRGGLLVNYGKGTVQFGLPPETIKDSLMWGLNVPTTFVILGEDMFDRQLGINIAEFEFPAYFNFFVFGKRVTLITTRNVERRVRLIFQETLLGPKPGTYDLSEDFASDLPGGVLSKTNQATHWPDFALEGLALDKQRETITVDALLNFENVDKELALYGPEGMNEKDLDLQSTETESILSHPDSGESDGPAGSARVEDNGTGMKRDLDDTCASGIPDDGHGAIHGLGAKMPVPRLADLGKVVLDKERNTYVKYNAMLKKYIVREGKRTIAQVDHRFLKPRLKAQRSIQHEPFDVPLFGVTMLGASHGFDPKGTTTGFVVWVNRRGIMVDPPPDSAEVLRDLAIPARLIDGMILTHCHADHDAGAFQKILAESSIKIYTTRTIMDSFIRKYSAISNLDANFLRGLFVFERVKIGETKLIHGGEWSFHYSLHVIPTIGFEVKFQGEGLVYSGDTCTSPKLFEQMRREKKIGAGRYADLLKRSPVSRHLPARKDADGTMLPPYMPHILHEAGVPPIHTPLEALAKLPQNVRERLFVVHVDQKQLSEGKFARKLKTIPQWSTLHITVESATTEMDETTSSLAALLSTVSFFRVLRSRAALDTLLDICRIKFYAKGTVILSAGETWNQAYVVRAGVAHEGELRVQGATVLENVIERDENEVQSQGSRSGSEEDGGGSEAEGSSNSGRADAPTASSEARSSESSLADPSEGLPAKVAKHASRASDSNASSSTQVPMSLGPASPLRADAARGGQPLSAHKPTRYNVGDMFGEQSLLVDTETSSVPGDASQRLHAVRTVQHDIVALTDLYTAELPRDEMLAFLKASELGKTILENLNTVARARSLDTWNLIRLNETLERAMNRVQQQEFQKLLSTPRQVARHEILFAGGTTQEYMYLISSGVINFFCKSRSGAGASGLSAATASPLSAGNVDDDSENIDLVAGALIGDVNCLKDNTIAQHVLTSKVSSVVYEIPRVTMLNFLNRFPGIKLQCIDRRYVV